MIRRQYPSLLDLRNVQTLQEIWRGKKNLASWGHDIQWPTQKTVSIRWTKDHLLQELGGGPCLLSIWHNIHTLKWHHPLLAKFLWGLMRTEIFSCKAKNFSMLEFIKHGMTTMSIFFFFHSQRPPLGQKKSMWEVCQPQRWLWLGL